MKKIQAYECEFCKKILRTSSGISKHEVSCFFNPVSKSCVTCAHFTTDMFLAGRRLSVRENEILRFEHTDCVVKRHDGNPDHDDYYDLSDEYRYLFDATKERFCEAKGAILNKLRTKCDYHKPETK